jgi:hypothetical protein
MKKTTLRIAILSLLAAVLAAAPASSLAQNQDKKAEKAAAEKKDAPAGDKKKGRPPLNGKIAAVDKQAKTVTIGQTTIQITSETRIEKGGKPATLDDVAVGEPATARVRETDDGKKIAVGLRVGPRPEGESKGEGKGKGKGKKKTEAQ